LHSFSPHFLLAKQISYIRQSLVPSLASVLVVPPPPPSVISSHLDSIPPSTLKQSISQGTPRPHTAPSMTGGRKKNVSDASLPRLQCPLHLPARIAIFFHLNCSRLSVLGVPN
jgi:hypothetical protein